MRGWRESSVLETLPSMYKALGLIPNTTKIIKNKKLLQRISGSLLIKIMLVL
jgi:hypothetical protein